MSGMTPSPLHQLLEKQGIAVQPDHAVWMTAQIRKPKKSNGAPPLYYTDVCFLNSLH